MKNRLIIFALMCALSCAFAYNGYATCSLALTGTGTNPFCASGTSKLTVGTGSTGETWSSSNTAVATVAPSTLGKCVVTGVAGGVVTITYVGGGTSCMYTFTVDPIAVMPTGPTGVCVGSTMTLSDATPGGVWSSSNTAKATVGASTGIVTGVATGTPNIFYTAASTCTNRVTYPITVSATPAAGTITGSTPLCSGTTVTFTESVGGGVWSSGTPAVGSVDASGNVTGISAGTTIISYTTSNAYCSSVATYTLTVNASPTVAAITGTPRVCYSSGTTTLADATAGGTWISTAPPIATITSGGVVTGVAAGTVVINYRVISGGCSGTASVTVTVDAAPNAGIISGALSVCSGIAGSVTLTSSGDAGGVWSSSNPGMANVGSATGVVTGHGAGTATISYTVTNTCGTSTPATAVVTVNPLPNPGTIAQLNVCVGATAPEVSSGDAGGVWTSSTPAIGTIDPSTGLVGGISAGSTLITYTVTTLAGCSAMVVNTVNVQVAVSVAAITGTPDMCQGAGVTLSDATPGGAWVSDNTSIATVGVSTGVVSGIAAGNTNISYIISNACGNYSSVVVATVDPTVVGTITGSLDICYTGSTVLTEVGISGGHFSTSVPAVAVVTAITSTNCTIAGVSAGTTLVTYMPGYTCYAYTILTLTVDPTPNPGTISGATSGVCSSTLTSSGDAGGVWTSSNPAIATVDPGTGVATGVTTGTATITYTVTNACGALYTTVNVMLNAPPAAPAAITGSAFAVCAGSNITLADATTGGTWSSTNTGVATVSSGTVTGVSGTGTTTISYTVTNTCGSTAATQDVTVNAIPAAPGIYGYLEGCQYSTLPEVYSTTGGGAWTSSGGVTLGTIDAYTASVLGTTAGVTNITYTIGCGSYATLSYTVDAIDIAGPITGLAITCPTQVTTLTADMTPPNSIGYFHIATTTTVSVAGDGTITGVATGTAIVTYSTEGLCPVDVPITVTVDAAPSVTVTPTTPTIPATLSVGTGNTDGFTVSTSAYSPSYLWLYDITYISIATGTGTSIPIAFKAISYSATTNITCTVTDAATGCYTISSPIGVTAAP